MATRSTAQLLRFSAEWEDIYPSAQLSGIVGDLAHKLRGGYHISREDQPENNYSVTRPDDRLGPDDAAAGVDMNLALADMKTCHGRLRAAWTARDPRLNYVNAWNGWDGDGDAGRYDVVSRAVSSATDDHKWHIHLEFRRRYVNNPTAMDAVLSVLRGERLEDYDMPTADEIATAVWKKKPWNSANPISTADAVQQASAADQARDEAQRATAAVAELREDVMSKLDTLLAAVQAEDSGQ